MYGACLSLTLFMPSSASNHRWLGSFNTGDDAGMAYDAAAISQKGCKAKTNFKYLDFQSIPRSAAETQDSVKWELLPKEIAAVRKGCPVAAAILRPSSLIRYNFRLTKA